MIPLSFDRSSSPVNTRHHNPIRRIDDHNKPINVSKHQLQYSISSHLFQCPAATPPPPPHVIPVRYIEIRHRQQPLSNTQLLGNHRRTTSVVAPRNTSHANIYGTLMLVSVASCWRQGKSGNVFSG